MRLLTHLLLPVALLTGCAQTPSAPDLDLHMVWLGAENDAPPSDVATVTVQRLDAFGDEVPGASADYTLARLDDLDGDGRPELEQRQLPTNEAFTLRITARDSDGATNYRGQLGPITLAPGERRYAPVYLYKTSTASVVASLDHQFGLFPTATTLHDGRVLVAGGFDTTEESTCPPGMRETSICVVATGTNKAHLFDPASAQFYEVESGMLAARGGHTATPLPNGRVLIAGGAAAAYLVFEATNDEELPRRNFELYPLPSPDSEDFEAALTAAQQGNRTFGGHASFEIFDALRNAETEDVDRDGDPSRGAFVGSIDGSDEPSPLNNARCLHTASPATGAEGESTARVVLAGGVHGDATGSWEVFDDRRPGGSGVYDNRGAILKAPRRAPSSEPIPGLPGYPILIAGGGGATDVNDLAEVWYPLADNPNGQTISASAIVGSEFAAHDTISGGARLSLVRPSILSFGEAAPEVTVRGWFGPLCTPVDGSMSPTPTYDDGSGLALCSASNVQSQGYRVSGELLTTSTAPEVGIATSFAAPARLGNGGIVLTGGIRNLTFTPMTTGALFTLTGSIAGPTQSLGIGRFMHAAAGFQKEGVLLVGGATSVNGMLVLAGGAHASQL